MSTGSGSWTHGSALVGEERDGRPGGVAAGDATTGGAPVERSEWTAAGGDLVAAVDFGGTKIAGALVDGSGQVYARCRRPTPARADAETIMASVAEVVAELTAAPQWSRVRAVGVGSAGPIDAVHGTVSPVNVPAWRGFPLAPRIAELAGGLPTVLTGDGVAMTAAEHRWGAARGEDDALCFVVSTGVGGGLVLGGRLLPGRTGNAGHLGHITVDFDGEPCVCGGTGCVEQLASGTSIARWARENGWRPAGEDASAAAVAQDARRGEPVALAAFDRAGRALAGAIAATATLVEIRVAVIGGGVAAAGEVLFEPVRRHLDDYATLSFARGVNVVPATLGGDAGLIGAAAAAAVELSL
ncbi:ROK family protein [Allostreptomyces psammosilenae]|uniref:Glucokinase n=1 Tax=Allostreptomyces psammosilenae TaxID=1892865 RepID=A0A853A1T9_9ACTN|nr:ROK family protein [Allostreptomyces psammosilenae]NYI07420.1 glucokinase [Allostreptomyces psammosilenae]